MKFGVQLYGMDEECKKDPITFFNKLNTIGYNLVEPCINFPDFVNDRGWKLEEFENYFRMAKDAGLDIISCHILSADVIFATENSMELAKKLGLKYIGWNIPKISNAVEGQKFVETCMRISSKLKSFDLELILHNGASAIADSIDGINVFQWILSRCEDKVFAEPDVGWILMGGGDPEEFLWKNKKYIKAIHFKDFYKDSTLDDIVECPIGHGKLDVTPCFQFARAMEIPQFVDQDASITGIMEDVETSMLTLKDKIWCRDNSISKLCTYNIETGKLRELCEFNKIIEAPNWMKDGDTIIYNSEGKIWKYSISKNMEELVNTGFCDYCNNDHVLSPNESSIAVSHSVNGTEPSQVFIVPFETGVPILVTKNAPCYLHGWSPDGDELAYCAFREINGKTEVDIYSISVDGGEEKQLTSNVGFNDGPEYSPDGKDIWFNSTRSGLMQLWKMDRSSNSQLQMTFEDRNNWFAHISPDGKKVVNLSYSTLSLDPNEHLPNMNVELWIMDYDGKNRNKLLVFFGGQGSMNVNSWSDNSKEFAFVIYELKHK